MKTVLMCDPKHFEVSYDINPWMTSHIGKVDNHLAQSGWFALFEALSKIAIVKLVKGVPGLPDLVFTANAGSVHGDVVVLSRFTNLERTGEEPIFREWFQNNGFNVIQPALPYEGEGDHIVDSKGRHWLGSGFRTNRLVSYELEHILRKHINVLELVDPRWYHLDTCFCPLPNGGLMWYPNAFSKSSQDLIYRSFSDSITVSTGDALRFGCNCVGIGEHLFIPNNTTVANQLRSVGYTVHEFELSEFIKSGGAAKCLVLNIN
jgi:N-dimethylarginine dimethylaminohydrolase